MIVKNGLILLPGGIRKGDLEITDGVISKIGDTPIENASDNIIDAGGKYILPGFIDIHTNGIAGFDFTNGLYDFGTGNFICDEDAYPDGLGAALREYAQTGVTRAFLTSLAAPIAQLKKVFGYLYKYRTDHSKSPSKEIIAGINIEGTFIKSAEYRGAHNPAYFYKPSIGLFNELQEAAGGLISIVNVVPEWGEPALRLIEFLYSKRIVCASGHTGASGLQYRDAVKRGLKLAVHFLNGPTGSSVKSLDGGGAVENVLLSNGMFAEIIVDGYHVDRSYVLDTIKRKGFDKIVAITDSMFAAGLKGLKEFQVLGIEGRVSRNGEYLHIKGRANALFGSMLTMDVAFSNLLTWFTTPVEGVWNKMHYPLEFEDALIKTSALCSKNPAILLGLYEPETGRELNNCTGSIEIGKSADFIIAGIESKKEKFSLVIDKVFVKGISL
jgi:N-acetylglucosamine-6-phosphate deacetylase